MDNNNYIPYSVIQSAVEAKIMMLAAYYGLEPNAVIDLLTDWNTWEKENLSWIYVNRN